MEELFRRIRRIEKLTRMIGEESKDMRVTIPRRNFDTTHTELNSAKMSVSDEESRFGRSQKAAQIEPLSAQVRQFE